MAHDDTICAIATPPGQGGIGVIRVSGPGAVSVADRMVRLRNGRSLVQAPSHRLQLGEILSSLASRPLPSFSGTTATSVTAKPVTLDTALVVVMRGPHSYTGEDVVEFHCHGGPVVLRGVCEELLALGARLAEPGEFTKRAFLNGRLDLTQAEGVLDTIQAKTEQSLRAARELACGSLSAEIGHFQDTLAGMLAEIEAGIDFVEEDISFVSSTDVADQIRAIHKSLSDLLDTWESGRLLRQGAKVVIHGKPNVGKSSLLNALLKYDRAIVTAIPGTTRDLLEEEMSLCGVPIRLVDSAGIRQTDDPVEQEGVRRTRAVVEDADVTIVVLDGSAPLDYEDRAVLDAAVLKPCTVVVNKADQPQRLSPADERDLAGLASTVPVFRISALTGLGLEAMCQGILGALPRTLEAAEGLMVTRLRHRDALTRARDALSHALESTRDALPGEFLAVDLRAAVTALGELAGTITTDDLLTRIFSEFCIGK